MIVYLDTSALLKLFVEEPESSQIRETVEKAIPVTHLVTYAEMRAALARNVWVVSKKPAMRDFSLIWTRSGITSA
ncbi:MAG: PIN domain-containing protein [Gammaproteobacteria bacterium]